MIYDNNDNHVLVKTLKKNGFNLFYITYARPSYEVCSGWWIDNTPAYGTEYYETHKVIKDKYLGRTLKEAMKNIKNIKCKR